MKGSSENGHVLPGAHHSFHHLPKALLLEEEVEAGLVGEVGEVAEDR